MAKEHLFPRKDSAFSTFFYALILYLFGTNTPNPVTPAAGPNAVRLGISLTFLDEIWQLFNQWADIFARATNELTSTGPLVTQKNTLRKTIEDKLREIYGDIPESKLTNDDRVATGMKERDTTPTRTAPANHAPDLEIEVVQHLNHKIRVTDPDTPDSIAVPDGQSIEISVAIADANLAEANIPFNQNHVISKAFFNMSFQAADVGQTVYYQTCFINAHGERGPKSLVKSAVIM
jgi:hypothetical protein